VRVSKYKRDESGSQGRAGCASGERAASPPCAGALRARDRVLYLFRSNRSRHARHSERSREWRSPAREDSPDIAKRVEAESRF